MLSDEEAENLFQVNYQQFTVELIKELESSGIPATITDPRFIYQLAYGSDKNYEVGTFRTSVVALIDHGASVAVVETSQKCAIILASTPFSAGVKGSCKDQYICDTGVIIKENARDVGYIITVSRTIERSEYILHLCSITNCRLEVGDEVTVLMDKKRRENVCRNHCAGHVIHQAAKRTISNILLRLESFASEDRILIYITTTKGRALDDTEVELIQDTANSIINSNSKLYFRDISINEVKKINEITFIAVPRTLSKLKSVGIVSIGVPIENYLDNGELPTHQQHMYIRHCDSTHLPSTKKIEAIIIVGSSYVGRGVTQLTAVTGVEAKIMWSRMSKIDNACRLIEKNIESSNFILSKRDVKNISAFAFDVKHSFIPATFKRRFECLLLNLMNKCKSSHSLEGFGIDNKNMSITFDDNGTKSSLIASQIRSMLRIRNSRFGSQPHKRFKSNPCHPEDKRKKLEKLKEVINFFEDLTRRTSDNYNTWTLLYLRLKYPQKKVFTLESILKECNGLLYPSASALSRDEEKDDNVVRVADKEQTLSSIPPRVKHELFEVERALVEILEEIEIIADGEIDRLCSRFEDVRKTLRPCDICFNDTLPEECMFCESFAHSACVICVTALIHGNKKNGLDVFVCLDGYCSDNYPLNVIQKIMPWHQFHIHIEILLKLGENDLDIKQIAKCGKCRTFGLVTEKNWIHCRKPDCESVTCSTCKTMVEQGQHVCGSTSVRA